MPTVSNISQEEWDRHKKEIESLYIGQDLSLQQVKEALDLRGLKASKEQYARQFRKWGLKKHRKATDWEHVARTVKHRSRQGKASKVVIGNEPISSPKLRKEMGRVPLSRLSNLTRTPSPLEHIQVFTPPLYQNAVQSSQTSGVQMVRQDEPTEIQSPGFVQVLSLFDQRYPTFDLSAPGSYNDAIFKTFLLVYGAPYLETADASYVTRVLIIWASNGRGPSDGHEEYSFTGPAALQMLRERNPRHQFDLILSHGTAVFGFPNTGRGIKAFYQALQSDEFYSYLRQYDFRAGRIPESSLKIILCYKNMDQFFRNLRGASRRSKEWTWFATHTTIEELQLPVLDCSGHKAPCFCCFWVELSGVLQAPAFSDDQGWFWHIHLRVKQVTKDKSI